MLMRLNRRSARTWITGRRLIFTMPNLLAPADTRHPALWMAAKRPAGIPWLGAAGHRHRRQELVRTGSTAGRAGSPSAAIRPSSPSRPGAKLTIFDAGPPHGAAEFPAACQLAGRATEVGLARRSLPSGSPTGVRPLAGPKAGSGETRWALLMSKSATADFDWRQETALRRRFGMPTIGIILDNCRNRPII
jgi:hypothetical protein